MRALLRIGALAVPLAWAGMLAAQPPGDHPGRRGPPPPAAFDACKGKKAGDDCQVTFGERTMNGKCGDTPDGKVVCRPQPPPEMLKACEGKKEGDACTAQRGDRKMEGQCHKGWSDKLVCRPSGPPPGH
jgi:hypothetical protein